MSRVDHYAVLGLAAAADHETIRRAWVRAARASHPDGFVGATAAEQRAAELRIRAVNEAWRVLGDAQLRKEYDRARRRAGPAREPIAQPPPPTTPPIDLDDPDLQRGPGGFVVRHSGVAMLLRLAPVLVVGALLLGTFVATALFSGSRAEVVQTTTPPPPECVRIRDDGQVRPVPCQWENDGVIDESLPLDVRQTCSNPAARTHDAPIQNRRLCLVPYEAVSP